MPESKKVFIVEGSTGEYSDHEEWLVAAYLDEQLAQEHVRLADEAYRSFLAGRDPLGIPWVERCKAVNPYDPDMDIDYSGTEYTYWTVELRQELPKVKEEKDA